MNLKTLATAVADVVGAATGFAPVITTVEQLIGYLGTIKTDLTQTPVDVNGQPLTLATAQAHLQLANTRNQAMADTLQQQTTAALADDAKEAGQ